MRRLEEWSKGREGPVTIWMPVSLLFVESDPICSWGRSHLNRIGQQRTNAQIFQFLSESMTPATVRCSFSKSRRSTLMRSWTSCRSSAERKVA